MLGPSVYQFRHIVGEGSRADYYPRTPSFVRVVDEDVDLMTGLGFVDITPSSPVAGGSALTVEATAGEAVGGHRLVRVGPDSKVYHADHDDGSSGDRLAGLTLGAASAADPVVVATSGSVDEPSWSWDVSKPLFLGSAGAMTQSPPSSGVVLSVGRPLSPTRVLIAPATPVYLT